MFDKEGGLRAAAESFNSIRSGPRKEVEDAGLRNEGSEGGEDGGTDSVLSGSKTREIGNLEAATAMDACSDAQKASPSARMTRSFFFPITYGWLLLHITSYASS